MSTTTKAPFKYNITRDDGELSSITVFFDGDPLPKVATVGTASFKDIVAACENPETDPEVIKEMFNVGKAVVRKFSQLTERVSIADGRLFFDNDPVDEAVAKVILAFYVEGNDNLMPLVHFYEKLMQNPNEHSRQMLYTWMSKFNFGIMPDGDLVAYKGVARTGGPAEDIFRSIHSGKAIVNGELHTGTIPTSPGVVVEMPRSEVNHDPRVGCSTGLHAGSFAYASSFGRGATLRVKINPRDVVSVPSECDDAKMRVCRYRVMGPVNSKEEPTEIFHPNDELRTLAMEAVEPKAVAESRAESKVRGKKNRAARLAKKVQKATKKMKEQKFPKFYEDFTLNHFRKIEYKRLQWLAREWEVKAPGNRSHEEYAQALAKEAANKRREAKKYSALKPSEKRKVAKDDKPTTTRV